MTRFCARSIIDALRMSPGRKKNNAGTINRMAPPRSSKWLNAITVTNEIGNAATNGGIVLIRWIRSPHTTTSAAINPLTSEKITSVRLPGHSLQSPQ